MKVLTIDMHPGAGSQIVYNNVETWTWDDTKLEILLDNKTTVRFNPAYVIALVWQEIETPDPDQTELFEESDVPPVKEYEDRL
jgi:hypothetical protein